jgi:hypothetical protein
MYHHSDATKFSREDCENAVGRRVSLTLTGKIVEARESDAGPFVIFEIDERFGLPTKLGLDLDLLEFFDLS